MSAAASVLSLLLAICMALSPTATPDGPVAVFFTPLMVSFHSPDGTMTAGLNKTEDGSPVISFNAGDFSIAMTDDAGYLTDESGTYTVPADALYPLLAGTMGLPSPTEDDETALALFASSLLLSFPPQALGFTPMGTGFSVTFDLDELAHELHTLVPSILTTYADYFDPTLAKYTPALLGEVVTAAQLAEAWPQLGLDRVSTGISFSMTMLEKDDGFVLIGSTADANYIVNITGEGLSFEVTTADGTTYSFGSADTVYVAQLLDTVLNEYISEEAFSFRQTAEPISEYYKEITTTIKVDTAVLSADLNRGLADVIAQNADEVNLLLDKYRSWVALADASLASQLSAEYLVRAFAEEQLFSLPATTGELVIAVDQYNGTADIDGYLGKYLLAGMITTGRFAAEPSGTISLILTEGNNFLPLVYNFDYSFNAYTHTMSLSANEMLFGLFNSITFSITDAYDFQWNLTTDTNVLRAGYSNAEQYAEVKVGPVSASLRVDENEFVHMEFYSPEFFADLHTDSSNISFDSTFGGFDLSEHTYDSLTFNGYLNDGYRYRSTFGFTYDEWLERLDAYLNTSEGDRFSFSYTLDSIVIRADDDLITLHTLENPTDSRHFIAVLVNGERFATLATTDKGSQFLFELYQGEDTSVTPYCTLTFDAAPAPFTAPADATIVDAETFLRLWEARF